MRSQANRNILLPKLYEQNDLHDVYFLEFGEGMKALDLKTINLLIKRSHTMEITHKINNTEEIINSISSQPIVSFTVFILWSYFWLIFLRRVSIEF